MPDDNPLTLLFRAVIREFTLIKFPYFLMRRKMLDCILLTILTVSKFQFCRGIKELCFVLSKLRYK
jgi:hypothetical protein